MLGEKHELLPRRRPRLGDRSGAVGQRRFRDTIAPTGRPENLTEEIRELAPLGVLTAVAYFGGQPFESDEGCYLELQLRERGGRRRLIEHGFLCSLHLVLRGLVEILDIVHVE